MIGTCKSTSGWLRLRVILQVTPQFENFDGAKIIMLINFSDFEMRIYKKQDIGSKEMNRDDSARKEDDVWWYKRRNAQTVSS